MELVETKKHKKTEIGFLPTDWLVKKFTDCADIKHGFQFREEHFSPNGIKVVKIGNLKYSGELDLVNITFIPEILLNDFSGFLLKRGDVLMALTGATLGKCSVVKTDEYLLQNYRVGNFKCKPNTSNQYVYYLLLSPFIQGFIKKLVNEAAQPNLGKGDFDKFIIPLPPTLAEQTLIANALSDADALISSLEQLIAKKKLIKQGAMQQLLKPKKGWEVKKLGEVGVIVTGSTPPTHLKEYWNGFIPWITPTDISNNQKNIYHSEREISVLGLEMIRKLPANTLLVTCIASIGKNAILRNNGACNQQINAIIPNANHNVDFLYYLIENNKKYLLGNAGITATLMISKKDFSEITFSFPTIGEQNQIATILSEMDTEIASLETKLDKYRKIKQGMMQNLLTGKIRLV